MIKNTFPILATSLFLACSSVAASLPGFTYMSPKDKNTFWEKLPVKICPSKDLPQPQKDSLVEAAKVWNSTFDLEIFTTSCEATAAQYTEGQSTVHGVYWVTNGFEKFTDKTSLARTLLEYDDSGKIHDADILLNGQYYDWNKLPIDNQTVFVHELGHVLGLKHFFLSLDSSMNYYPYVSGYIHRNIGQYEKIVVSNLYKKSKEKAPPYLQCFFKGDTDKAIKALEKTKTKTPENFYALGYLYKSQKKFEFAKANFAKFLETNPRNSYVRQQLGESYWSLGDLNSAEKEFLTVVEADSKNYESLANLGSIYLSKGDTKKSQEFLMKSLAIQPAHWVACALLLEQTKEEKYRACLVKYGPEEK